MKIFYPPTLNFDFLKQRPQHILSQAAKRNHFIVYCNQHQKYDIIPEMVEPNLKVYHNANVAIKRNTDIDVLYTTWARTKNYVDLVAPKITIFDNVDNFKEWRDEDEEYIKEADIVFVASESLYDLHKDKRNIVLLKNACDYSLAEKKYFLPSIYEDIRKPIILMTGACGSWCDVELMESIPNKYQLVFVGQGFGNRIPKNAMHIPTVSHNDLMQFICHSDVCILPFNDKSDVSYYSCPIKTYEYLSFGKPVVSTNIPESKCLEQDGVVYIGNNHLSFINNIKKALNKSEDEECINKRKEIAKQNTWTHRWLKIEEVVYKYCEEKGINI